MKSLKRLTLSFTLLSVLSVTTFAGITETPPCVPGETSGPPCTSQSITEEPTLPGQTETPPASNDVIDAIDLAEAVLWALSLF